MYTQHECTDVSTYISYHFCVALQSKKMSTSLGSSTSGGDLLSTTLERRQSSKEISEIALGMKGIIQYYYQLSVHRRQCVY